jgi:tRNA 2-thiouridine synthesizing protein E
VDAPGRQSATETGSPGTGAGLHTRLLAGREVLFDGDGFLHDFADWTDDLCVELASERGLTEMTETHWRVIRFLREYYAGNGRAPLNRQLSKGTGMKLLELESCFPDGIKYGARRLAGLPNPKGC